MCVKVKSRNENEFLCGEKVIKQLFLVKDAAGRGADQGYAQTCCFQSTLSFPGDEAALAPRLHLEAELRVFLLF